MPIRSPVRRTALLAATTTAVFGLAGCTTTNGMLARQPEEVFHSHASADQVATCFTRLNHMRLIERADGAKVLRITNGYGWVTQTFSIYPEGPGSRIEMRRDFITAFGTKWQRCVGLKPMPTFDDVHG